MSPLVVSVALSVAAARSLVRLVTSLSVWVWLAAAPVLASVAFPCPLFVSVNPVPIANSSGRSASAPARRSNRGNPPRPPIPGKPGILEFADPGRDAHVLSYRGGGRERPTRRYLDDWQTV